MRYGSDGPEYISTPLSIARTIGARKYKLAAEILDRWNARGQTPRRTQPDLAPLIEQRAKDTEKREVRLTLARTSLTKHEKLVFLAQLMGEIAEPE